ncbi:MAG TPA: YdcF family protein [Anaerolineaceae bacterium]|nr:YdcF family protein [Anaerolineaceae bacterium]
MLAIIGKLIGQFLTPLGIIALLLFFGLIQLPRNPRAAWMPILALLLVAVLGNFFFASFVTRSLEWRYMPPTDSVRGDAIVLLAEGILPQEPPRQQLEVSEAADRIFFTAKLYREGSAPRIIISGNAQAAVDARTELIGLGVPENVITLQDKSKTDLEHVRFAVEILKAASLSKPVVVTSALNMDKAVYLFTKSGISVVPAPADYQVTSSAWERIRKPAPFDVLNNLMPTASNFSLSSAAITEYASLVYYRLRAIF